MTTGGDAYYNGSAEIGSKIQSDRQLLREQLTPNASGLIVAMVGLPARGKSFISRKVERFLKWTGNRTQTFNVGKYRRDAVDPETSGKSDFFDKSNRDAVVQRMQMAMAALADAIKFLDDGGKFAIFDATNSTVERRKLIADKVSSAGRKYSILWVEAVCDDEEVVMFNMLTKVRYSPDFQQMTEEQAMQDLKQRIANYEEIYETVQDSEGAFIKLFNLSSKVMANHCYGRVAKSILPYLMAHLVDSGRCWSARNQRLWQRSYLKPLKTRSAVCTALSKLCQDPRWMLLGEIWKARGGHTGLHQHHAACCFLCTLCRPTTRSAISLESHRQGCAWSWLVGCRM